MPVEISIILCLFSRSPLKFYCIIHGFFLFVNSLYLWVVSMHWLIDRWFFFRRACCGSWSDPVMCTVVLAVCMRYYSSLTLQRAWARVWVCVSMFCFLGRREYLRSQPKGTNNRTLKTARKCTSRTISRQKYKKVILGRAISSPHWRLSTPKNLIWFLPGNSG